MNNQQFTVMALSPSARPTVVGGEIGAENLPEYLFHHIKIIRHDTKLRQPHDI